MASGYLGRCSEHGLHTLGIVGSRLGYLGVSGRRGGLYTLGSVGMSMCVGVWHGRDEPHPPKNTKP